MAPAANWCRPLLGKMPPGGGLLLFGLRQRLGDVFLAVLDGFELHGHRVHHVEHRLHFEFEERKNAAEGLALLRLAPSV